LEGQDNRSTIGFYRFFPKHCRDVCGVNFQLANAYSASWKLTPPFSLRLSMAEILQLSQMRRFVRII